MKTLHLNLKRKWFDMILSGEKKEEYRECSEYWNNRFVANSPFEYGIRQDYDTITFSNGYAKDRYQFEIELIRIDVSDGRPEWGATLDKKYFVLFLGKILASVNTMRARKALESDEEFQELYKQLQSTT